MADDGLAIKFEVDPAKFAALLKSLKAFSPALATATRKNLRVAGTATVNAVRAQLVGGSTGRLKGKAQKSGFRQQLAAGTKLAIVAGKTRSGITITTSSANLAENAKGLRVAWNSKSFRHPVPNSTEFVTQSGRPYFGSTIRTYQPKFEQAVSDALAAAIKEMQQ